MKVKTWKHIAEKMEVVMGKRSDNIEGHGLGSTGLYCKGVELWGI